MQYLSICQLARTAGIHKQPTKCSPNYSELDSRCYQTFQLHQRISIFPATKFCVSHGLGAIWKFDNIYFTMWSYQGDWHCIQNEMQSTFYRSTNSTWWLAPAVIIIYTKKHKSINECASNSHLGHHTPSSNKCIVILIRQLI